ncbi:hypothetical protein MHUMG1_10447 [Metarhizium humberi]|uniref:Transcription factor domain-containing protein n=1 Tax=Metarhizium humberi TaxID=2596975 RepID=A0A9P8M108_9HYPO|nr:hypothetical protein MHUMG1_10447 [Metarhizium humberi]
MRLHHDRERLGLGPFEVEIRRRVWWQAVANEFRRAMLSGQQPVLPNDWDTRTPQNVNEADVFEPLTDQPGWGTEILGPGDLLFKGAVSSFERISAAYEQMGRVAFSSMGCQGADAA